MPSIQNITNIPPPRVNFIDERTGLMSREWYRFFLNLFTLTGGGTNPTSLEDLQLGPAFELTPDMFVVDSLSPDANSSITTLSMSVDDLGQSLETLPVDFGGTVSSVNVTLATTGTDVSFSVTNSTTAPVIALSIPTASATNRGALSAADWTAFNARGSGSVTSVGQTFTGGIISVGGSPITTSGTLALTVAGTSGGVVYFTSASTWATSAVLAANALMVGGGAGLAPATVTTGTGVVTALGVAVGTAGSFVVNGGALGTPSSGTVTNLTGTASININGTVGATTANTGAFTSLAYTTTLTGGTGIVNLGSGQFYKDASGNVGIGTSGPLSKLDVGTGDLRFSGTGQRILGDMSNATIANRLAFQSSTVNGNTNVHIIPNGTSVIAGLKVESDSAITTGQVMAIDIVGGSDARVSSNIRGAGTYVPLTFYTGGAERVRIDSSGNMGVGATANASAILDVQSTTKGFRLPNMTTTQKNAITSPAAGLMVFDTTLAKACVYSGAAWQTISSI